MEEIANLNLVLLGNIGAGKSESGNTILGRQAFKSKTGFSSVTQDVAVESESVCGFPVTVYDTPGFCDADMSEEKIRQVNEKVLQRCESGLCAYLLVVKADRFTENKRRTVEMIEKLLGEKRLEKTWILFTGGDELEDMTIEEFINETESLKKLVQKYDQRYHVFNNKKRGHTGQVHMLFRKIHSRFGHRKKRIYGLDTLAAAAEANPLVRKTPTDFEPDTPADSLSRRIVLLGKTGVGKSAAGNTILGENVFKSVMGMNAVTRECSEKHGTVSGRSVSVVDTPGLFNTQMNLDELITEMARSVCLSSPGPHACLIVLRVDERFSEQEQKIPQMIEMLFGQEVLKYSIIVCTHGDQLEDETVEKLIEENGDLRRLVDRCGGRYHVFNNRDKSNREQVNDLLQKIDTMIELNGGGHYSNQMFQRAQIIKHQTMLGMRTIRDIMVWRRMREREEEEKMMREREEEEKMMRERADMMMRERVEMTMRTRVERMMREREREEKMMREREEMMMREREEMMMREREEMMMREREEKKMMRERADMTMRERRADMTDMTMREREEMMMRESADMMREREEEAMMRRMEMMMMREEVAEMRMEEEDMRISSRWRRAETQRSRKLRLFTRHQYCKPGVIPVVVDEPDVAVAPLFYAGSLKGSQETEKE